MSLISGLKTEGIVKQRGLKLQGPLYISLISHTYEQTAVGCICAIVLSNKATHPETLFAMKLCLKERSGLWQERDPNPFTVAATVLA